MKEPVLCLIISDSGEDEKSVFECQNAENVIFILMNFTGLINV